MTASRTSVSDSQAQGQTEVTCTEMDLFELAACDVLGILSEDERVAFDQAFAAASPRVQAQVRREQARIACDESLLPKVATPPGLRAKVIAAVRRVMDTPSALPFAASTASPSRGVNPIWRTSAIGAAAAAVALGLTTLVIQKQFNQFDNASVTNEAYRVVQETYGPSFTTVLTDSRTMQVKFTSDSASFGGRVMVLLPDATTTHDAYLICENLPGATDQYDLAIVNPENNVVESLVSYSPAGSSIASTFDPQKLRDFMARAAVNGDMLALTRRAANEQPSAAKPVMRGNIVD